MNEPSSPAEILNYLSPDLSHFVKATKWRCTAGEYNSSSFGNAFVDVDAGGLELRMIKDRGSFFAEINCEGCTTRYDLVRVLRFLGLIDESAEHSSSQEHLFAIVSVLSNNLDAVSQLFRGNGLRESGFLAYDMKKNGESLEQLRDKSRAVRDSKK